MAKYAVLGLGTGWDGNDRLNRLVDLRHIDVNECPSPVAGRDIVVYAVHMGDDRKDYHVVLKPKHPVVHTMNTTEKVAGAIAKKGAIVMEGKKQ